ncbi:creatininase family protein [Verticiella sediminum]|uniref:Creatininase family protein n=1 Tax=Verticiella sediminum TaxID=1247510 RepID=A0A556AGX5_9BURK|nr:creatininase family protein [Verticiella sediminum]TSH92122.1 creatininase family protein [Verticiella sediminum]
MTIRLPRRLWVDMTTREFSRLPKDTVAVLPVASVEQHGPHLPVYVDACLNEGIVQRAIQHLPEELPITFLPMQAVGKANEHLAFPGTLSLSAETLTRVWTEIGECVHRAGIRKLVLFNSHGGQPQVMDIVARDLRVRLGMFVVCCDGGSFGPVPGEPFPELERRHGIHGGSKETSMMLALRPDLVQMEHAQDFRPASIHIEENYRYLRAEGRVGFGWQAQDLNPAGAAGNALDADAERGDQVLDHAARGLATLLAEVHRFPIDHLRATP